MDLTIKDVAKLFNISEAAIHRLLLHNKIPSYCINGEHRFGLIEIENWMLQFDLKQLQETASYDQQIYPLTDKKKQQAHFFFGLSSVSLKLALTWLR